MSCAGCMEVEAGSHCETAHHLQYVSCLGQNRQKGHVRHLLHYAVNERLGISQGRSGEANVRNVFKCKDHKFNTFHCASREAGGRS